MRILARFFVALFCLAFLANQAQPHSTQTNLLLLVSEYLDYVEKGLELVEERVAVNSERLAAIENHLERDTSYRITLDQRRDWLDRIRAKETARNAAIRDLKKLTREIK